MTAMNPRSSDARTTGLLVGGVSAGDSGVSAERQKVRAYAPLDLIANKYELIRPLGEGGMGEVWVALNQLLDVKVAIKFIRTRQGQDAELAKRLLKEARAAARLIDPAIVRVYDFGVTAVGDPYIVMELLQGEDLFTALSRHEKVSAVRSVRILLPISHALSVAHANDVVHRDIKPENIFLVYGEGRSVQPKLLDFGIAKYDPQGVRLTKRGFLLGSPSYMSPEQARGEEVDALTDIWAFCVVLYEMLTGRLPFDGESRGEIIDNVLYAEPVPITHFGVGDDELWAFIEAGLSKERSQRWATMADLGTALAAWLAANGEADDVSGSALKGWLRVAPVHVDPFCSVFPPRVTTASDVSSGPSSGASATADVVRDTTPPVRRSPPKTTFWVALAAVVVGGGIVGAGWMLIQHEEEFRGQAVAQPVLAVVDLPQRHAPEGQQTGSVQEEPQRGAAPPSSELSGEEASQARVVGDAELLRASPAKNEDQELSPQPTPSAREQVRPRLHAPKQRVRAKLKDPFD